MRLLIPTFLVLLAMALNHVRHGSGCWGLQPGGTISSNFYLLQALISLYAVILALRLFVLEMNIHNTLFMCATLAISAIAVILISNSPMHTSVHNQGPENLAPFLSNALVAIIVGIQIVMKPKPPIRLTTDCPECGYPLKHIPGKICPECGHQALYQSQSSTAN